MKFTSKTLLSIFILIPITYILSNYLLFYYTEGDQLAYTKFYEALYGAKVEDVVYYSQIYVSGAEPLSAFIFWIGSNLNIEINTYISLLNVVFIVSFFLLLRKNDVKVPMIGLLLTNYYVVVLLTSAQRLKIAYIFTIIAMLFLGKIRLFFFACTPFAHLQSLILLGSVLLSRFEEFFNKSLRFIFLTKSIGSIIGIVLAITIISLFLFEGIKNKVQIFASSGSVVDIVNILILILIVLFVSHKRSRILLALIPLIPIIVLIGAKRVNMIAFSLAFYYLMEEGRLSHPLIYLLMIYFSIKTIDFIEKIFTIGQGFF